MSYAILFWYLGLPIFKNQIPFLITLNTFFGEQPHVHVKELGKAIGKTRTEVETST